MVGVLTSIQDLHLLAAMNYARRAKKERRIKYIRLSLKLKN
jgi:hypothetical protein